MGTIYQTAQDPPGRPPSKKDGEQDAGRNVFVGRPGRKRTPPPASAFQTARINGLSDRRPQVVEMAAEAPEVEFRCISETHGIDYIATQRAQLALDDVEPGR